MPQSHGRQNAKFTNGGRPVVTLIRSLVSSVIEHGQIETTVPKAKAAKKVLERVITAAKKGTPQSFGRSSSWLHNRRVTMPVLHTTLRERFADRTGGYSRIHLAGSRYGDGADMAVLQLLDGPGEIKFEMLARTLGRKIYEQELRTLKEVDVFDTQVLGDYANWHLNNDIRKALRLRPAEARDELRAKAEAHRDLLRAEESVFKTAGLQYEKRPPRDASKRFGSVALEDYVPQHLPKKPEGRFVRPGELLPAMAVQTPTKPVPFADRHLWARLPAKLGGRGGVPSEFPRPDEAAFGSKIGQTGVVPGVDGVPTHAEGWSTTVGGGNGEFPLGRSPIQLARLALGKRRTPVRRWGRDGDGMGG